MAEHTTTPGNPLREGMTRAQRPTGPLLGIIVTAALFLAGQAVFLPLLGTGSGEGVTLGLREQLLFSVMFAGSLVLLAAWVRWKERRPLGSLGFVPASGAGRRIGRGAITALAFTGVVVAVNQLTGQAEFARDGLKAANLVPALLLLIGFAIQGSTEEIFCRGYLTQALARKWGLVAAVLIQTVFFAALHAANGGLTAVAVANLVLVALFLSFWSLAEGGLWEVCAFHAVWNWSQGNVYGAAVSNMHIATSVGDFRPKPGSNDLITGGGFGLEGSLLTTALLAVGTICALIAYRRSTVIRAGAKRSPAQ
ncbi:CPBP family intramembrane glutamic endopeptidase [Amycolatopsis anabasis]|uniref:CPBP family intramembrane glutamic endopeptidase n=1 Tax=Amycolatopsis anabasis TaxID=1840409 RepID=UPI00131B9000|nr:type II CAAX endopeptidase family protein [Amycolatopsis anabasis]